MRGGIADGAVYFAAVCGGAGSAAAGFEWGVGKEDSSFLKKEAKNFGNYNLEKVPTLGWDFRDGPALAVSHDWRARSGELPVCNRAKRVNDAVDKVN